MTTYTGLLVKELVLVAGLETALRQGTPAGDRGRAAGRPDAPVDHSRRHPGAHLDVPGRRQGDPEGHLEEPDPAHPVLRLDRAGRSGPGQPDPHPAGGHRRDERSGPSRRCRRRPRPGRLQGLDLDAAGLAAAVPRGTLPSSEAKVGSLVTQYRETTEPKAADALLAQLQRQAAQDLTVLPISQGDEHSFVAKGQVMAETSFGPGWQLGFFGMGGAWMTADLELSGVHTGPLQVGERVTLSDPKGRRHSIVLAAGAMFHTSKGGIAHDELIGGPEGVVVTSTGERRISGDASAAVELHRDHAARRRGGLPEGCRPDSDGDRHLPRCAGARGGRRLGCADLRAAAGDRTDRAALSHTNGATTSPTIARRNVTTFFGARAPGLGAAGRRPGGVARRRAVRPRSGRPGRCSTCSLPGSASTPSPGCWSPAGCSAATSRRPRS